MHVEGTRVANEVQWTEEDWNELRALSSRVEEQLREVSRRLDRVEEHLGLTDRKPPTRRPQDGP
jgi:hypothetical protein